MGVYFCEEDNFNEVISCDLNGKELVVAATVDELQYAKAGQSTW